MPILPDRVRRTMLWRRTPFLLVVILMLAAVLRVRHISDSGFWLDEFCSVECSTGRGLAHVGLPRNVLIADPPALTTLAGARPWTAIWTSMSLDNHPPLYFILLRWWRDLFGESDGAARALSIAPSLAAIVFLFDAVRTGLGRNWSRDQGELADRADSAENTRRAERAALWACLLMAVAMPQVHFAQEARQYTLLLAFGMLACAALVRVETFGPTVWRAIALATGILGMLLTHYYAVAPVAALAMYAGLRLRGPSLRAAMGFGASAILIFIIAWGPFLWRQRNNFGVNNAWQIEPAEGHGILTIQRLLALPARFLIEVAPSGALGWCWAAVGGGALILCAAFLRRRPALLLWVLWLVAPVALVGAVDLLHRSGQTNVVRYTLIASPAVYAMLAAATMRWPRSGGAGIAAIAIVCLCLSGSDYSSDRIWPLMADTLKDHVEPGDAIVYAADGRDDWYAGALYLGVRHYAGAIPTAAEPAPIVLLTRPATAEMRENLRTYKAIWLVCGDDDASAPVRLLGMNPADHAGFSYAGTVWEIGGGPE